LHFSGKELAAAPAFAVTLPSRVEKAVRTNYELKVCGNSSQERNFSGKSTTKSSGDTGYWVETENPLALHNGLTLSREAVGN
jgi:hypothetical protein